MPNRRINLWFILTLVIAIAVLTAGCAKGKQSPDAAASSEPEGRPTEVSVFYGDVNGAGLIERKVNIHYAEEDEKYLAALQALTKPTDDPANICLFQGFSFNQVEKDQDKLTVDLSFSDENRVGAPGEKLMLEALEQTIFQFPEIDAIEILVDGKRTDSLMGHNELPYPIRRSL